MTANECVEHGETFWDLFKSLPHWEFEIFLMVVVDGIFLGIAWPFLRKHWTHHVAHDEAHTETRKAA